MISARMVRIIRMTCRARSFDDALEYAIGQMGPADHFDVGHFDIPADTSHDTVHHA